MRALGAALAALALAAPAWAIEETPFRYERALEGERGDLVQFEPDSRLFGHAKPELADLRIVDADGRQVPWRLAPEPPPAPLSPGRFLNRGRQGGRAVALLDRGPRPDPVDRIDLELPDRPFVGRVDVLGSDDRRSFTFLSSTAVYDLRGARPARSTAALVPLTDFRYLLLRATGVRSILGASVSAGPRRPSIRVPARATIDRRERSTVVDVDLGFPRVPVEEIRIRSSTPRFDRPVEVSGANVVAAFAPLGAGRVSRFDGVSRNVVPVETAQRYLRVEIENGDDPPLADLEVGLWRRPRTVVVAGGFTAPYRLLYGAPGLRAPDYDFAALPLPTIDGPRSVRLGVERGNPDFEAPPDTRSFVARHPRVVQGALGVAALALALAGFLALRRRA